MQIFELMNPDLIRSRTAAARTALEEAAPQAAPDQRLTNIATLIGNSDFGCQKDNVRKLVELILGTTLPTIQKDTAPEFTVGTVIIHNKDDAYLVRNLDDDRDALILDATGSAKVNASSYICRSDTWRLATDEEVEDFLIDAGLTPTPAAIAA